ncbi:MAG: MJ1477/TM1410 family putative glycoside hydrolase [Candidatus Anammoxibacter sp.]
MRKLLLLMIIANALIALGNFMPILDVHRGKLLFAQTGMASLDTASVDNVTDWAYQLQEYGVGLNDITDSKYDLIVMDYSSSGEPDEEFTSDEINSLKIDGPCERKIILAYMSIGEAEEFRFYFDDMPSGLLFNEPNPNFPDNIKVRFWDERWQDIILGNAEEGPQKSYLDRIIDAGFDGVYLDIIDGYEFWGPKDIGGNGERETAASDMIDFVIKVSEYARNARGKTDFIVVPQNGAGIIDPSSYPFADDPEKEAIVKRQEYFAAIDAIGAEDTFYFGTQENNNSLNVQDETIELLNMFRDAGKVVLSVDYVQSEDKVDIFYNRALAEGYVPYASVRDLDTLTINEMHEPLCNNTLGDDTDTGGKSFTFNCEHSMKRGFFFGLERLTMNVGDTEDCTLKLTNNEPGRTVKIATKLMKLFGSAIEIEPSSGVTDENGELGITITAINKGTDWAAWAVKNDKEVFEFNKESYDAGLAWGMFVEVR